MSRRNLSKVEMSYGEMKVSYGRVPGSKILIGLKKMAGIWISVPNWVQTVMYLIWYIISITNWALKCRSLAQGYNWYSYLIGYTINTPNWVNKICTKLGTKTMYSIECLEYVANLMHKSILVYELYVCGAISWIVLPGIFLSIECR